jgi:hypothetical protein
MLKQWCPHSFRIIAEHWGIDMPEYDILTETFCLYCQEEFRAHTQLQEHVLSEHPDTYAASSILDALEKDLADGAE